MADDLVPAYAEPFQPDTVLPVRSGLRGVDAAWAFDGATGAGVRVAVIDSGTKHLTKCIYVGVCIRMNAKHLID